MPRDALQTPVWADYSWQMSFGERFALEGLLSQLRPALAIEIGTAEGGSLRRIAAHAGEVHSFDIEPKVAELGDDLPNVVFHIGDSAELLPTTLAELAAAGRNVDFVLVDGDHSSEGVERDARALLDSDACRETTIVFHDAANDDVRAGLARLDLPGHPKVSACFLDFVPGYMCRPDHPRFPFAIWNGLALVVLGERGEEVIGDRDHLEVPDLYRRARETSVATVRGDG
jgi:Methyltransferase domain